MPRRSIISGSRRSTAGTRKGSYIEGLDQIEQNLERVLNAATGKQAKAVFLAAATEGKKSILNRTPMGKTGNLRRSIFADEGDPAKSDALVGINRKIAPHANLVEFGHAGSHPAPPHPFFRPGIADAAPKMATIIKDGLVKVIEDAPKK